MMKWVNLILTLGGTAGAALAAVEGEWVAFWIFFPGAAISAFLAAWTFMHPKAAAEAEVDGSVEPLPIPGEPNPAPHRLGENLDDCSICAAWLNKSRFRGEE